MSQQQQQQHESEQQCHICMHTLTAPAAVKGCGHSFCSSCIKQWVSSKQQPACPVCRADITHLVFEDGTEQQAEPAPAAAPAEAEPDLSCLDHSYFLSEVSRLLSRAQVVHDRVFRDAYGCGRRGGGAQHANMVLDDVQDVLDELSGFRSSLEGEQRFDPEVLLQELYRLDSQLTCLQAGDPSSSRQHRAPSQPSNPWHPEDSLARLQLQDSQPGTGDHDSHEHDHEHDDGYDYAYDSAEDDDWHEGLAKTPGRRPTQRPKQGRNNSGSSSNQQQQQQRQHQQLQPQQRGPIPRWRQGT